MMNAPLTEIQTHVQYYGCYAVSLLQISVHSWPSALQLPPPCLHQTNLPLQTEPEPEPKCKHQVYHVHS